MFDRFYRGDPSYKGNYTGFGVGLHIAQQYIHLLKGTISLESKLGRGTTFTVTIPVEISKEAKIEAHKAPIDLSSQLNVCDKVTNKISSGIRTKGDSPLLLIVEDNRIALMVAEGAISKAHCQYLSATNGKDALKLAKSHNFDLILTDIGLPDLSGYELAASIREYENKQGKPSTPIIGLTAHAEAHAQPEALGAGMNKVISKPINQTKLQEILHDFLSPQVKSPIKEEMSLGQDLPDTEAQLFAMDAHPLLDVEAGINTLGNEIILKELLKDMIEEELPMSVGAFEKAYATGDWETIEKIAHKIKSSALYCGTTRLQYACQYLERYQKAGHVSLLHPLYNQLLAVIKQTNEVILMWL